MLQRHDTDTIVGIIFTYTAFRAGASLGFFTIYPWEMILLHFPPCTGSGHVQQSVHVLRSISQFYLGDGAFERPDDAGRYIPSVVFSSRKNIIHVKNSTV